MSHYTQQLIHYDLGLIQITEIRRMIKERNKWAQDYEEGEDENDRNAAVRGIEYCDTQIKNVLLIPVDDENI